jgi:hypothetical protein
MNNIWEGVGQVDGGWLRDNISLLFELTDNKLVSVKDMLDFGWLSMVMSWIMCRVIFRTVKGHLISV